MHHGFILWPGFFSTEFLELMRKLSILCPCVFPTVHRQLVHH